jgi:hypothetical protein
MRDAKARAMSNEPRGVSSSSTVSNLFDPEQERAICCLCKQARILRTAAFRPMKLVFSAPAGALPAPSWVFILDDGRALAWFREGRPYVVHPTVTDLCDMHGARNALVHAA